MRRSSSIAPGTAALLAACLLLSQSGCLVADPGTCLRHSDCGSDRVCSNGSCVKESSGTTSGDAGDDASESGAADAADGADTIDSADGADATDDSGDARDADAKPDDAADGDDTVDADSDTAESGVDAEAD
jgi:hypothetical protein